MQKLFLGLSVLLLGSVSSVYATGTKSAHESKSVLNAEIKPNEKRDIVNKDVMIGNWHILKGKVHEYWGKLTNDEIEKIKGSREVLRGKLQKEYGYTTEKAEEEINKFNEKNK